MHGPARPASHDKALIATLGALVCMSAIAVDVSMPVLPLVARDLGAEPWTGPLIVSLYLAGYALGQIPVGLLGDRYGRRPVLYAGLSLFVAAGLVTALATDMTVLLAARFLQGCAGAIGPVLGRAVIRDISAGVRAAQLMSVMVTLLGVATLAAPVLGSLLVTLSGWRATFGLSVVTGLALLVMVRAFVPETRPVPAALGPVRQFRASAAAFFAVPQCWWGAGLVALAFGGYMTVVAGTASVIVDVYGMPAGAAGPIFALAAIAYIAGAWVSRRFVARAGVMGLLRAAVAAFAVATVALGAVTALAPVGLLAWWGGITLYLLGIGLLLPNATALALEPVPRAAGFGAAIVGTGQIGAAALAAAVSAALYAGTSTAMTGVMTAAGALTVLLFLAGRGRIGVAGTGDPN